MQSSDIDQLTARGQLLIAKRENLVRAVLAEERDFSDDELKSLVAMDASISAFSNILTRHQPKASADPAPPIPPNKSDVGSDYRIVAAAFYEQSKEGWKCTNQLVADYGKWMVATIAAAQLGGIYFVGGIESIAFPLKEGALWALVAGLVLIFGCALTTYYNWQANSEFYAKRTNVASLVDPTALPKTGSDNLVGIRISYVVAIVLGVAAVACIPLSAFLLSRAAHHAAAIATSL